MDDSPEKAIARVDAVLLGWLSFTGYLVSFSYEWGYISHFGLPFEVIDISPTQVFLAIAVTGLTLGAWFVFLSLIHGMFSSTRVPVALQYRLLSLALVVAFFLILFIYYGPAPRAWPFPIWIVLWSTLFVNFIAPMLTSNRAGSYIRMLEAQDKLDDNPGASPLTKMLLASVPERVKNMVYLTLLSACTAYCVGNGSAFKQTDYYVLESLRPVVVLRVYKGIAVTAEYDELSRSLRNRIELMELTSDGNTALVKKSVGPFKRASRKQVSAQKP